MPLPTFALSELADQSRASGRLAIDTEFMGEGRYRTLLCLVQVAVPAADGVRIEVIDPLDDDVDPAPLAAVLADPDVEVVMHAARQDVALLRRVWRTEITSLFDTQVAAGFAGLRAQAGYESLLGDVLGIRLPKSASYTKWDRRPLSAEQVAYAREDVEHLFQLADALQDRLRERGRLEWAREECRFLETVSDERDLDAIFDRLPRIAGLDARSRAVARELVEWRESLAATQDRTVQSVLADAALVEIAKRKPDSRKALENIRGINPGNLRRRGDDILEAVARGRDREPIPFEGERRPAPHPGDAPLIALSEALVRTRVADSDLAYELVASRADLQAILAGLREGADADVRTLHGWRRELVGDELLALLRGERALAIDSDLKVRVTER
ncbi:ribonuclease D [Capillimicrobium parvum]|uniref:Ribonuclease D n=1 Tax=Capillimicrobium parvum TaxID=2884022 RepID=A0A9E6XZP3_9ACTN|nr:HRDC domain-containing protein [Capillimicrobium parvum]UGS37128.1 Ribonuclease D [Capillimicrobium parvum]